MSTFADLAGLEAGLGAMLWRFSDLDYRFDSDPLPTVSSDSLSFWLVW